LQFFEEIIILGLSILTAFKTKYSFRSKISVKRFKLSAVHLLILIFLTIPRIAKLKLVR
jgi:hypothetical protein